MRKVVILGGSFDPIHSGHLEIAKKTKEFLNADEVWFLVAKNPRWKSDFTDAKIRLDMINLAIQDIPNMKICTIELEDLSSSVTYTIDTARTLKNTYPDYKFYFIIGSDQLEKLHLWKDVDELSSIFQFVLVTRPDININYENIKKYKVIESNVLGPNISSTNIRLGVQKDSLDSVYKYIKVNGLYLEMQLRLALSKNRYEHSLNVAKLASEIALKNNLDPKKAYIAGLLHDCAKELSSSETISMMKKYYPNELNHSSKVFHQFLAPIIARERYGIEDDEIHLAMKYHATSSSEITDLGKIIYSADKIEPSRGYPSDDLIALCYKNYLFGYFKILEGNIKYLYDCDNLKTIDVLSDNAKEKAIQDKKMAVLKLIINSIKSFNGNNITLIDARIERSSKSFIVICEGITEQQCEEISRGIKNDLAYVEYEVKSIENKDDSKWLIVDANDVTIHIVNQDIRGTNEIEKMYSDMPLLDEKKLI